MVRERFCQRSVHTAPPPCERLTVPRSKNLQTAPCVLPTRGCHATRILSACPLSRDGRTFVKAIVSSPGLPPLARRTAMRGATAWRAVLNSPGALLFQSGPESTGYPKQIEFPPVLNIRPLDLSLRLESRGPICPKGPQKATMKAISRFKNSCKIGRFGCNSRQRLFCLCVSHGSLIGVDLALGVRYGGRKR